MLLIVRARDTGTKNGLILRHERGIRAGRVFAMRAPVPAFRNHFFTRRDRARPCFSFAHASAPSVPGFGGQWQKINKGRNHIPLCEVGTPRANSNKKRPIVVAQMSSSLGPLARALVAEPRPQISAAFPTAP